MREDQRSSKSSVDAATHLDGSFVNAFYREFNQKHLQRKTYVECDEIHLETILKIKNTLAHCTSQTTHHSLDASTPHPTPHHNTPLAPTFVPIQRPAAVIEFISLQYSHVVTKAYIAHYSIT